MSTGTSTIDEIKNSITDIDKSKLCLLHCVSNYPLNPMYANLPKILDLKKLKPSQVGYSDHMTGIESCKIALEYGIDVIEKHFTIDNNLPGRDNAFAILPAQLKELKDYLLLRSYMNNYHGPTFVESEETSRNQYTGRFNHGK